MEIICCSARINLMPSKRLLKGSNSLNTDAHPSNEDRSAVVFWQILSKMIIIIISIIIIIIIIIITIIIIIIIIIIGS